MYHPQSFGPGDPLCPAKRPILLRAKYKRVSLIHLCFSLSHTPSEHQSPPIIKPKHILSKQQGLNNLTTTWVHVGAATAAQALLAKVAVNAHHAV